MTHGDWRVRGRGKHPKASRKCVRAGSGVVGKGAGGRWRAARTHSPNGVHQLKAIVARAIEISGEKEGRCSCFTPAFDE